MLRVKTFVSTSPGRGLGLFSAQLIEPDTITWEYDPEFDLSFSREQIDSLPEMNRAILLKYGYFDDDLHRLVLPCDDLRFINHSDKGFNIGSSPRMDVAIGLIAERDELLCNYLSYEDSYFDRRKIDPSGWL